MSRDRPVQIMTCNVFCIHVIYHSINRGHSCHSTMYTIKWSKGLRTQWFRLMLCTIVFTCWLYRLKRREIFTNGVEQCEIMDGGLPLDTRMLECQWNVRMEKSELTLKILPGFSGFPASIPLTLLVDASPLYFIWGKNSGVLALRLTN